MNATLDNSRRYVLEVIACTVEDAVNAEKGGADRLEVIRDLGAGGYTPALSLVHEIRKAVTIPMRVMLREEPGYGLTEIISVERMCSVACALNDSGIEGVVLGFLHRGEVDIDLTKKVLACAPDLKATFHHAFEDAENRMKAIDQIKQIARIDRILAHGGYGTAEERIQQLRNYAGQAGSEIAILAGGRIDANMIREFRENSDIREFHIGRAARRNGIVSVVNVSELVNALERANV